jgi:LPS O-antigen subunit length determinant protein (WzzB/FepE family)
MPRRAIISTLFVLIGTLSGLATAMNPAAGKVVPAP